MLAVLRLAPWIAPRRSTARVCDDSDSLHVAPSFLVEWPDEVTRPTVGLVEDVDSCPYWTKYRRFLQDNSFPYRMVDIHSRSWIEELDDLDLLVWRPGASLHELQEQRRKTFYMHEFLGLATYPSLRAINLFNDKVLGSWALRNLGADTPATVVSHSEADALAELAGLGPEVVWKITAGAGSAGVERLTLSQARRAVRRVFSEQGRRTYWSWVNQKGYVYAQALERDLRVDMRVIVVGPLLLGYYRDVPPGDFRASGSGLIRKTNLPFDALEESWSLAQRLDVGAVAIDFIADKDLSRRKIIEFASYIKVDDAEELAVGGVPGVYVREGVGRYVFREGRYWLPELMLAHALARHCGSDGDKLLSSAVEALSDSGSEPISKQIRPRQSRPGVGVDCRG